MAAAGNQEALKGLIALDDGQAYKELFVLYYPRLFSFLIHLLIAKSRLKKLFPMFF